MSVPAADRTSRDDTHLTTRRGSHDPDGVGRPRNHVHLIATVTSAPERRVLPSGDEVVSFGVSVPRDEGGTDAIPIQVGPAPPSGRRPHAGQVGRRLLAEADRLRARDRVAITGHLRRRWWDAGGMRRSRIEVSATAMDVIPAEPP